MKNTPIKYLVYRELIMLRKSLVIFGITWLLIAAAFMLVQLSLSVGNLADIFADIPDLRNRCFLITAALPAVMSIMVLDSTAFNSIRDVQGGFDKFRLSMPVPAVRFAMSKYIVLLLGISVALCCSAIYLTASRFMGNEYITAENIRVCAVMFMAFVVFLVIMQCLSMYMRSVDKAGVALIGTAFAIAVIYEVYLVLTTKGKPASDGGIAEILGKVSAFFPYMLLITIAVVIAGFIITVMVYKRRER